MLQVLCHLLHSGDRSPAKTLQAGKVALTSFMSDIHEEVLSPILVSDAVCCEAQCGGSMLAEVECRFASCYVRKLTYITNCFVAGT